MCIEASEGFFVVSILREMGIDGAHLRIFSDSSGARAVVVKRGRGCVKHFDIRYLWMQEGYRNEGFQVAAIGTTVNWADALTQGFADTGCSPQHSVWEVMSDIFKASATCVGFNMGHGSKCWCRPCTPERHSRAEAAGGFCRYFLAHAGLTKNNPPSFSRADARNRPRAHRSVALEYNFGSYFAPLWLRRQALVRARLNSPRCKALWEHARIGRPRVSRSTHRNASRQRHTMRSRWGCRPPAWPVILATGSVHPHSLAKGVG